ncbi:hypothetical protein [Rhodococcus erythropolis]|uniref:Uncharacterized protein n=1 Tax=Rhodococcus erythropolis TaxID=1833 RepID=A0A8I0ZV18_RHOER|nr:hypothetical protein [Rhodococcus erythropolis]MBH5141881.1 hypothetical protein [Rhodococcus erythropolis]
MSESDPQSTSREVVKNYTRARKFPQLLGMTPDGKKLPGGPYSYTQFVGAGLVALVLWKTPGIWATGSLIRNVFVFLALVGVTAWGLGKLPIGGRNPLSMVAGVSKALGSPAQAPKVAGPTPRRPRVRALAGMVTVVPVPSLAAPPVVEHIPNARPVRIESKPAGHTPPERRRVSPPSIPRPPLATQPAASTSVQRLVAMAAASHNVREKA